MRLLNWLALTLFAAWIVIISAGCAARPMICIPIKLDGGPAFGCVDARDAKDSRIEPWDGAPAPTLPEKAPQMRRPGEHGEPAKPYYNYEGFDPYWKEKTGA